MPIVDHIPAVLRVILIFCVVLAAMRKKVSLGNAFMLGAVLLGLVFGLGPVAIVRSAVLSLIQPKTLALSGVVCLILVLSHSLEAAGQMQRLLDRFRGLIRNPGLNLVLFPALIGLLPMPGGAIFSAPMVKHLGDRRGLSAAQLSYTNYWFRHIWEYWWPLYPGVLLTTAMAGLDIWVFILFLFPLTLVAATAGFWPLRGHLGGPIELNGSRRSQTKSFFRELTPVLIAIGFGLAFGSLFSFLLKGNGASVAKELGLILALMMAVGWVWRVNEFSGGQKKAILLKPELLRMFYMIASILIFKGMLEDSQAVTAVSEEFVRWHIPLMPIAVLLPFLVGTVVGITIAFVGTTFPILISLIGTFGETQYILPYMMLALACGFVGVLFSPLHLCLLLTNEYFHTSLGPVYRQLLVPCAALMACSILYFFFLRGLVF